MSKQRLRGVGRDSVDKRVSSCPSMPTAASLPTPAPVPFPVPIPVSLPIPVPIPDSFHVPVSIPVSIPAVPHTRTLTLPFVLVVGVRVEA